MVNTEIRLIIFFEAKDGEALYSQQKQDQEARETGGGRGLSGLHWAWCIGRGPHLQLRQEPQGTSDFRLRSQGPCRVGTGESGLVLG